MGLPIMATWELSILTGCTVSAVGGKYLFKDSNGNVLKECTEREANQMLKRGASLEGGAKSYAEWMLPQDAELYLQFKRTGSMEGFTEAQINSVRKLDELIALKEVDYQDILNVRNSDEILTNASDIKSVDDVVGGGEDALQIGKTDLDALRNKLGVPETDTIAVGKTDVKGLEGVTFEGQSPKVRSEAGLPDLDEMWAGRNIKSPGNNPLFTRHAEEVLANDFDRAVIEAGINPQDVSGVLKIHQSNPTGCVGNAFNK